MKDHADESGDVVIPSTIRSTVQVNAVRIVIRDNLWLTWAQIAIDEEAKARAARAEELNQAAEQPGKQSLGDLLLRELKASLLSVTAASLSLDALYGELSEIVIEPELLRTWRENRESGRKRPARHRQVLETIKRAVAADGDTLARWADGFEWLFHLRNAVVHFKDGQSEPVPHPSGTTNTSKIHQSYCVENAERAVDLLLEVLMKAVSAPRLNRILVVRWAKDLAETVERLRARRGGEDRGM